MRMVSTSPAETETFALRLAAYLAPGDFISLRGELGAGKTRFAGGVAQGLAVDPSVPVTSPTYTLLNIYQGRVPFYHFDLYRLHGDDDAVALGFTDYFSGDGVCVVEWAERLVVELPGERLEVLLEYEDEQSRVIELHPHGERFERLLERFASDSF
jgi:tRNA threonylcarbamoyladenosine biosynthesis protein TsaE